MSRSGTSTVDDEPSPMLPPSDGYIYNDVCIRFSSHYNIIQCIIVVYIQNYNHLG